MGRQIKKYIYMKKKSKKKIKKGKKKSVRAYTVNPDPGYPSIKT